ncbi:hypothetical protein H4R33_004652 [Dimargaris cristalligena]|nr:hypothetical protein H4R33_004652 [Dimargaris cristalligena]
MSKFSVESYEEKLKKLFDTQDSISLLSQSNSRSKITYIHLANDVLQSGRKKGPEYPQEFKHRLPGVVKDFRKYATDSLRQKLERVLTVWEQRSVYDPAFVRQLRDLLNSKAAGGPSPGRPTPPNSHNGTTPSYSSYTEIKTINRPSSPVRVIGKPTESLDKLIALNGQVALGERQIQYSEEKCIKVLKELDSQLANPNGSVDNVLPGVVESWQRRQEELQAHVAKRQQLIGILESTLLSHQEKLLKNLAEIQSQTDAPIEDAESEMSPITSESSSEVTGPAPVDIQAVSEAGS